MEDFRKTISSTLELKPGERVHFPGGTVYEKSVDGSLRRGFQKLNKKQRRERRRELLAKTNQAA